MSLVFVKKSKYKTYDFFREFRQIDMGLINVNNLEIGGDRAFIIADIGSNHMQDLQLAKDSIDAVVESGADAVKFQSIQLNELYHKPNGATTDFIKKLEFPEEWHLELNQYCKEKGIIFFSSPTYLRAVDLLEDVNAPLYKLASAQIGTFPQIVERVASLNKPTIFSTGISGYEEIIEAVKIFKKYDNDQFIILHCNSIYPTPPERVNLQLMNTYRQMFGNPVGFSDHTVGRHISVSAVAMGANVIEKHFTLDRNLDTPDSNEFASDPDEFKKLVLEIRAVEAARGQFVDRIFIQREELSFKESIRYKLVALKDLEVGDKLDRDSLQYLRSNDGIDCRDLDSVLGMRIIKPVPKNELVLKNCIYDDK